MKRFSLFLLLFAFVFSFASFAANDDEHGHNHHEDLNETQLGLVHFPVSCSSAVQKPFARGVAETAEGKYQLFLCALRGLCVSPDLRGSRISRFGSQCLWPCRHMPLPLKHLRVNQSHSKQIKAISTCSLKSKSWDEQQSRKDARKDVSNFAPSRPGCSNPSARHVKYNYGQMGAPLANFGQKK